MKERTGNIWELAGLEAVVAFTTNGFVKKNGECVMGRGIALDVKTRFPYIPRQVGTYLNRYGNRPFWFPEEHLVSFPVKPVAETCNGTNVVRHMADKFEVGAFVPGWACKAQLQLIERSAIFIVEMANKFKWEEVLMPRPGCGNGELSWEKEVRPILQKIFDDRFFACSYGQYVGRRSL